MGNPILAPLLLESFFSLRGKMQGEPPHPHSITQVFGKPCIPPLKFRPRLLLSAAMSRSSTGKSTDDATRFPEGTGPTPFANWQIFPSAFSFHGG
jgi:hypothetical protein